MLRSREILSAVRRSLLLVCVCLALNGEAKPGPVGVLCDPDSSQCGPGVEASPALFQLALLRGKRSATAEEFWKRGYPLQWARRYRSGPRAWLSPDDDVARYFRASSSVKDKGDAFWKRVDPQGFWRRAATDSADEEEDNRKADDGHRGVEEDRYLDTGKRLDQLIKDDGQTPEERLHGFPNKQRRRQEGLTRPEFNPTGW